jgi:pimeloyl-ACP methyl ester carboxylesterase
VRPFPEVPGLEVEHRFVEARGLRFHVAEAGDGPPLVLLHGWPQHWWMWRRVLPELARTHRCIVPDLRGLGWSDAPRTGYAKTELAADVLAVLDQVGVDAPVPLCGHDWGALTSILICRDAPERVTTCLALSVPAPWDAQPDPRRLLGIAHMPFLSAPFAEHAVPQVATRLLEMSGFSREEAEPYVEVLREPARRRATVGYYRTFLTREVAALAAKPIGRTDVPIRMVGGAKDPVCRWSPSVEKVAGAGHFLPEDRPEVVVGHVQSFL